ncbi:MAG: HAMP domain-containing protein, partial [Syntrophobacteraceae bacterium]|nr:HAMP domain-containing protein [Syntrophobacteraceae bacterium]
MLGIRGKLSLGFGGLLLIIAVIGIQSIRDLTTLGHSIDVILRENYRSVLASQQMKEALERLDSGVLFTLLGDTEQGNTLIAKNTPAFAAALQTELDNITLPGEGEKASHLSELFSRFMATLKQVQDPALPSDQRRGIYFTEFLQLFHEIKNTADAILQMNQQNMIEANGRARQKAAASKRQMIVLLLCGTLLASLFVVFTGRWILRPISRLIRWADEIRRGNLDLVIQTGSRDEIGRLSEAFNEMASSLREFRRADQTK